MSVLAQNVWNSDSGHLIFEMTISITEFKARCLEMFRIVAETGQPITVEKHGKIVGVLYPGLVDAGQKTVDPFDRLIGTGQFLGEPEDSGFSEEESEALR